MPVRVDDVTDRLPVLRRQFGQRLPAPTCTLFGSLRSRADRHRDTPAACTSSGSSISVFAACSSGTALVALGNLGQRFAMLHRVLA